MGMPVFNVWDGEGAPLHLYREAERKRVPLGGPAFSHLYDLRRAFGEFVGHGSGPLPPPGALSLAYMQRALMLPVPAGPLSVEGKCEAMAHVVCSMLGHGFVFGSPVLRAPGSALPMDVMPHRMASPTALRRMAPAPVIAEFPSPPAATDDEEAEEDDALAEATALLAAQVALMTPSPKPLESVTAATAAAAVFAAAAELDEPASPGTGAVLRDGGGSGYGRFLRSSDGGADLLDGEDSSVADDLAEIDENSPVVRLRGLPFRATEEDLVTFFGTLEIAPNGIVLNRNKRGRATGDGFIKFINHDEQQRALNRDKQFLGRRYIEIFPSTEERFAAAQSLAHLPRPRKARASDPPLVVETGVVRLRGCPYETSEEDIRSFFHGLNIVPDGVLLIRDNMHRASGEGYVRFASLEHTAEALRRDKSRIGRRYLEVFASDSAEMEHARTRLGARGADDGPASSSPPQ